jgi:hypothetical protein
MSPVLQAALPVAPWADPALARMPGMRPVDGSWVVVDDAYAGQMAERARLLREARAEVLAARPGSEAAQAEALEAVLDGLPAGFGRAGGTMRRPDGAAVALDGPPLEVAARLIQEDLLILARGAAEHVLVAGLLCFQASWRLSEKLGRPLSAIHAPVAAYDAGLAARVQRMFDRLPPGRALWRANALGYADPALHQPRGEAAPRQAPGAPGYLRSERQTVLKLPRTGAVLFAVHTTVVPYDRLTPRQRATLPAALRP